MSNLKLEDRSVIKFLKKEGQQPKTIREMMVAVYGNDAPSYYLIKFSSKQFRQKLESIEDDPRNGKPKTATDAEMTQKVEAMVLEDRCLKVYTISKTLKMSESSVITILHKNLRKATNEKRPMLTNREVFLFHDNARVHKAAKIQHVVQEFRFVGVDHFPYISDLAASDFYLFRFKKKTSPRTSF